MRKFLTLALAAVGAFALQAQDSVTPNAPTNLRGTFSLDPDEVTITLTAPTMSSSYTTLESLDAVTLSRQIGYDSSTKADIHTFENPTPGESLSYVDTDVTVGTRYLYFATATLDGNTSYSTSSEVYAGIQPAAPTIYANTTDGGAPVEVFITAPKTDSNGNALTVPLTRLVLTRSINGTVTTLQEWTEDLEGGVLYQYTDNNPSTDYTNVYSAQAFCAYGDGYTKDASATLGQGAPDYISKVTAVANGDIVDITWTYPTNYQGMYLGDLTYTVTRVVSGESTVLSDAVTELSYQDNLAGALTKQCEIYYTVSAKNAKGECNAAQSNNVVAGPASPLPFEETFPAANYSVTPENVWTKDGNWYYSTSSYHPSTYATVYAKGGEGGMAILSMGSYTSSDYTGSLTSGRIDISGVNAVTVTFSYYRWADTTGSTIALQYIGNSGESVDIGEVNLGSAEEAGWAEASFDITGLTDDNMAVRFVATANDNPITALLDDISVVALEEVIIPAAPTIYASCTEGKAPVVVSITPPNKDTEGNVLTSLTKIVLSRSYTDANYEKHSEDIAEFTSVEPGVQFFYTDENPNTEYTNVYTVVAYCGDQASAENSASVTLGEGAPEYMSTVKAVAADGAVTITWYAPSNPTLYVNPESIKYNVTRWVGNDSTAVAKDLVEQTFTDNVADLFTEQSMVYYTVMAFNDLGNSNAAASNKVIVGPALALPFVETFPLDATDNLWVKEGSKGWSAWNVTDSYRATEDETLTPMSGEGAFAYVGMSAYTDRDLEDTMTSGAIDVAGAEALVVSFYYYNWATATTSTVALQYADAEGEFVQAALENVGAATEAGWTQVSTVIRNLDQAETRIRFVAASGETPMTVAIDDINVSAAELTQPAAPTIYASCNEGVAPVYVNITAPTKDANGDALAYELTKIVLTRSYTDAQYNSYSEEIYTIENPVMGQLYTYKDETPNLDYTNVYTAIAYCGSASSVGAQASVTLGLGAPEYMSGVKAVAADGSVVITWNFPTNTTQYIDPASLLYTVTRYADDEATVLTDELTEQTYTDNVADLFSAQTRVYYTVSARNDIGQSNSVATNDVIVGPALALPFAETFPLNEDGQVTTDNLWVKEGLSYDYSAWNFAQSYRIGEDEYLAPYLNEGGFAYVGMGAYTNRNTEDALTSSAIDVQGVETLVAVFYYYNWADATTSTVALQYADAEGEFQTAAEFVVGGEGTGWTEASAEIALNQTETRIRFVAAAGETPATVAIDEIKVVNKATVGINGINADNQGDARFFDLQGREIAKPAAGQVVIRVQGGIASKVVIR